jgi:tRNA(fMet)-specific endonuclease VapC
MRSILLDTNAYSAFKKGMSSITTIIQHADIIGMSTIVLGELISGFTVGSKYQKNMSELHVFLDQKRVTVLPVDTTTCTFYAKIYANLRNKGKPIPTNDIWIAATTLQHGYKLCSFDKHFAEIENLIVATCLEDFTI